MPHNHPLSSLKSLVDQGQLPPVQLWIGEDLDESVDDFAIFLLGEKYTSHPNFFALKALVDKKEITLEATHTLLNFLKTTPTLPTWRVVTIAKAESLNRQSTNALLKILEECPQKTFIFLLSAQPGKILPTLLSRCTKILFPRTSKPEVSSDSAQHLGKLLLTMMMEGPQKIQPMIDALEEAQCPLLVEGLCPFLYKIMCSIKGDQPLSPGIGKLLKHAPHAHWVEAYQACSDYLDQTLQAHLSLREILRGALYLVGAPQLKYMMNADF